MPKSKKPTRAQSLMRQASRPFGAHRTKLASFLAVFVIGGSILLAATHAATAGEPPMGLMIQVSSLSGSVTPATLKSWLDNIRTTHRNASAPGYINSVVLQDIADQNGTINTAYLDVIAPYLPGGATPAFDRAYIGTVDVPWTGTGSKYIEGIENASFRSQNITVSIAAAKAFKARYPNVSANWYVTYEANMAGFWDSNIEGAYKTYITQLTSSLSAVVPGKAVMWSPAFWTAYTAEPSWALPSLKANLTDLFTSLPTHLTIDLQDFVGQSGGTVPKESAASWANYLKSNWSGSLAQVEMNVEQFTQSPSGVITAGSATELPARENYYSSQGLQLGPSWEIRYWHQRLYGN